MEVTDEIIAALEQLELATIGRLARETRRGYKTIIKHLDQLREAGRVGALIPGIVPVGRI